MIFPVFFFVLFFPVCNKIIFIKKKYEATGLVFKIDAIDGRSGSSLFLGNREVHLLIYDLNTKKGTVKGSHSKNHSSKLEKSHLVLKV